MESAFNDVVCDYNKGKDDLSSLSSSKSAPFKFCDNIYNIWLTGYNNVKKLQNIGPLSATQVMQLASLTGCIPLEFYFYCDIKNGENGPAKLMKSHISDGLVNNMKKPAKTLEELTLIFQSRYHPRMTMSVIENVMCELQRDKNRGRKKSTYFKYGVEGTSCYQNFFRIWSKKNEGIVLEVIDMNGNCINMNEAMIKSWPYEVGFLQFDDEFEYKYPHNMDAYT